MKPRSAANFPKKRRFHERGSVRRSLWMLFGIAVAVSGLYSLAGFLGAPWLVDRWLAQYRADGAGRTASRSMVRFNPYTLVGEIVSIELRDAETSAAFTADRIIVDFAARSLIELRPAVSSIVIERPGIELASVAELATFARVARDTALNSTRIEQLEVTAGSLAAAANTGRAIGLSQLDLSLTALDARSGDGGDLTLDAVTTAGAGISIDGQLTADLDSAQGHMELEALALEAVVPRLGSLIEAAEPSGRLDLAADFSARSLLSTPILEITDAGLDFSELSLSPASGLTVTIDSAAANANLVAATDDEDLDLSGRIETDDIRVTIRDARATPPQVFVFDDTALLATADADGQSLILGGRLLDAGNAAVTVRVPRGSAARSFSIEASSVPVTTLSAYAFDTLGRRLAAGSADFGLQYAFNDSRADGVLQLRVRDLAFAQRTAAAGAEPASVELAAALLEDADGVIDLDLRFATSTGTVRDALADALAARIAAVTQTPFDTLATLAANQDRLSGAVPFLPGDAALGDRALASVEALADALAARPRLGIRVYGAYDATVDRAALARQQIELHVVLATAGANLQARPAPVDFGSARAQDVLQEFAGERLPAARISELAERFTCEGALAEVCERVYYEQLFEALVANEAIAPTTLSRLGRFRAQSVIDALQQQGVADERIELIASNNVVETPFGIGLAVELTALGTAPQVSAP